MKSLALALLMTSISFGEQTSPVRQVLAVGDEVRCHATVFRSSGSVIENFLVGSTKVEPIETCVGSGGTLPGTCTLLEEGRIRADADGFSYDLKAVSSADSTSLSQPLIIFEVSGSERTEKLDFFYGDDLSRPFSLELPVSGSSLIPDANRFRVDCSILPSSGGAANSSRAKR